MNAGCLGSVAHTQVPNPTTASPTTTAETRSTRGATAAGDGLGRGSVVDIRRSSGSGLQRHAGRAEQGAAWIDGRAWRAAPAPEPARRDVSRPAGPCGDRPMN